MHLATSLEEPETYGEAMKSDQKDYWKEAMDREMKGSSRKRDLGASGLTSRKKGYFKQMGLQSENQRRWINR
jgi:hypothetical protein